MKKKVLASILGLVSLLSLTSCNVVTKIKGKISGDNDKTLITEYKKVDIDKTEEDMLNAIDEVWSSNVMIGVVKKTTILHITKVSYSMYSAVVYKNDADTFYCVTTYVEDMNATGSTYEYKTLTEEGGEYPAQIVGYDTKNKIAVYKFESDSDIAVSSIKDNNDISCGNPIFTISSKLKENISSFADYKEADRNNLFSGTVSHFDGRLMMHPAMSSVEDYGSGVFDYEGNLIGINVIRTVTEKGQLLEGFNFAVAGDALKKIVDDIEDCGGKLLHVDYAGEYKLELRVNGDDSKSDLPDNVDCAIQMASKKTGNQFSLSVGDYITEVNGERVSSYSTFINACYLARQDEIVTLTVYRKSAGGFKKLTITN